MEVWLRGLVQVVLHSPGSPLQPGQKEAVLHQERRSGGGVATGAALHWADTTQVRTAPTSHREHRDFTLFVPP